MKPLLFFLAFLLCFLVAFVLQAQPTTGLLCGTIADSAGKPVPGAVVTVDTTWQITTQANGTYQIAGIPVGEHQLRISLPGSETAIADNWIMVQGEDTIVKNVTLYGSAIKSHLTRQEIMNGRNGMTGVVPGILEGEITDDSCRGLPGAVIEIVGTSFGAKTKPNGTFRLIGLRPGTYTIRISSPGRKTMEVEKVTIRAGMSTGLEVALEDNPDNGELRGWSCRGWAPADPLTTGSRTTFTRDDVIWR